MNCVKRTSVNSTLEFSKIAQFGHAEPFRRINFEECWSKTCWWCHATEERTKNLLPVPNALSLIQSRQIDLSFYILSRSAFSVFLCISILVLEVHSVNILMLNVICLPIVSSWFPLLCVSRFLYQSDALSLTFYALSSSFDISFYLLPMFWAHFLSLSKP